MRIWIPLLNFVAVSHNLFLFVQGVVPVSSWIVEIMGQGNSTVNANLANFNFSFSIFDVLSSGSESATLVNTLYN